MVFNIHELDEPDTLSRLGRDLTLHRGNQQVAGEARAQAPQPYNQQQQGRGEGGRPFPG